MKFTSPVISAGSGSLAGLTASRNKGGMYFRARAVPTNPGSAQQTVIRNQLATLVAFWSSVLTQAQRDGWADYAANVPVQNPLGASINLSGQQMYVRSNVARVQATLPRVDDAPTVFDLGPYTVPVPVSLTASTGVLSVSFTEADDWVSEDDAALLVYVSRPQNPGITYFKGPYQFAGGVLGNTSTPPTTPQPVAVTFGYTAGQRGFVKFNVARADGRYSTPTRATLLAV